MTMKDHTFAYIPMLYILMLTVMYWEHLVEMMAIVHLAKVVITYLYQGVVKYAVSDICEGVICVLFIVKMSEIIKKCHYHF